jgi:hypothetical protein
MTQSGNSEITSSQRNRTQKKKPKAVQHPVIVHKELRIWVSAWFPFFVFIHPPKDNKTTAFESK